MKRIFFVIILMFCVRMAGAQGMAYVGWDINIPVASSREFISMTSVRGIHFEGRYFIRNWVSVGMSAGWNAYYEYVPRRTYYYENGAMTATQYRYLYNVPIRLNTHFYPLRVGIFTLYGGLNVGTVFMDRQIRMSDLEDREQQWAFSMAPELGIMLQFGRESYWGALFSSKYNFSTFSHLDQNNYSSVGFNVGIYYKPLFD